MAPDSGEGFSDLKIRACPVAGSNQLAPLISSYNRHRSGLFPISQSYPRPTCAVVEAMDILHYNTEDAQRRATERAMREASHGTK